MKLLFFIFCVFVDKMIYVDQFFNGPVVEDGRDLVEPFGVKILVELKFKK